MKPDGTFISACYAAQRSAATAFCSVRSLLSQKTWQRADWFGFSHNGRDRAVRCICSTRLGGRRR